MSSPSSSQPPTYSCATCAASYPTGELFRQHQRIHKKANVFACHFCGKSFRRVEHLTRHEVILQKERGGMNKMVVRGGSSDSVEDAEGVEETEEGDSEKVIREDGGEGGDIGIAVQEGEEVDVVKQEDGGNEEETAEDVDSRAEGEAEPEPEPAEEQDSGLVESVAGVSLSEEEGGVEGDGENVKAAVEGPPDEENAMEEGGAIEGVEPAAEAEPEPETGNETVV